MATSYVDPEDTEAEIADERAKRRRLPVEAVVERAGLYGWSVRVPVHRENVTVEKRPVLVEEVEIGRRLIQETVRHSDTVRREELVVEPTGDLDVTQPIEPASERQRRRSAP